MQIESATSSFVECDNFQKYECDLSSVGIVYSLQVASRANASKENCPVRYNDMSFVNVMFGALASGQKLPPYIALRQESPLKDGHWAINYWSHDFSVDNILIDWMHKVWRWRHGLKPILPSVLLLNCFQDLISQKTKDVFKGIHTDVICRPSGLMEEFQILFDIYVNKPYLNCLNETFKEICHIDTANPAENVNLSLKDITQIILKSWEKITAESIAAGFKTYKMQKFSIQSLSIDLETFSARDKLTLSAIKETPETKKKIEIADIKDWC